MRIFYGDKGFSTVGTALALLVSVSLVLSMGGIYRVTSMAAEVQDVADAAALAAQNEVAEFMVAVRVCDAMVLSLSLTGLTLYGASVVALCVPSGAASAVKLMEVAAKILDARDDFSQQARSALTKLAETLPFLAAANAASVTSVNSSYTNSDYAALALLVPFRMEVRSDSQAEKQAQDDVALAEGLLEEKSSEMQIQAQSAEEAARDAQAIKERAFARDCGDDPGYCMRERAAHLANLPASRNPSYTSVDAWSFSVPLERAKSYYTSRLANEAPIDSSVEEGARSALRRVFYEYALEELGGAYVKEDENGFDAHFPLLPENTEDMRSTRMYTDARYPVTAGGDGGLITHAWEGCPLAVSFQSLGSIADMERRGGDACSACGFSASSLGKVAAASSAIDNGFEYHYNAVALAAREYEQARGAADEASKQVRDSAQEVFGALSSAMKSAAACRIDIVPPGSYGVIALATSLSGSSSSGFESPFAASDNTLGTRVAVSAATMVEDDSDEGRTVLNSLLEGVTAREGAVLGASRIALDCWSLMLSAYADGFDAVDDAWEAAVEALPLSSVSGLESWAEDAFEETARALGLQPAELSSLKPVLVNSGYVAAKGKGDFAERYASLKQQVLQVSGPSTNLFSSTVTSWEEYVVNRVEATEGKVELVVLEVPELGISVPVTVEIPEDATNDTIDFICDATEAIRSAHAQITGAKVWE